MSQSDRPGSAWPLPSGTAAEKVAAGEWIERLRALSGLAPFSFAFGGRGSGDLLPGWEWRRETREAEPDCRVEGMTAVDPETGLAVEAVVQAYEDFPAVEWVLHLENQDQEDTPLLERVLPLDATLPLAPGERCVVRYAKGALCSPDDFAPVEAELRPRGEILLRPGGGRSSSEVLPFVNLILGGRGVMLAVGWTGEWAIRLSRDEDGALRVQAGMAHTHLKLHPGERICTPRILVLPWEGEPIRGHNLLRRFLLAHHRPRPNGEPMVAPLCNSNWGGTPAEVHLSNIRDIAANALPFEYYWIDAEWFGGPGHWMEHAGDWRPRADLYPDGFRPISDAAHAAGLKLLLWFEPERVAPNTPWAREHPEWLLEVPPGAAVTWADYGEHLLPSEWVKMESARNQLNAGDRLFDLGNPEARRFLTDFLSGAIEEFGIDCLRWDSNIAQLAYWQHADAPDRQGMAEIRYVEGQYALWDELLARHPGLIIDNCASGGRRIDLETVGRTVPLWRTDYTVGHRDPVAVQCHTWGLHHWVPLNGTGGGYLDQSDAYAMRSTYSSALTVGVWGRGDAQQDAIPADYPYAHARDLLREYVSLRHFYEGDFYPITGYTRAPDAWMAYQLDRPDLGEGLVVVLKRQGSPYTRATFRLRGLEPGTAYAVENLDTGDGVALTGADACEKGIEVCLEGAPGSALLTYRTLPAREDWATCGCSAEKGSARA